MRIRSEHWILVLGVGFVSGCVQLTLTPASRIGEYDAGLRAITAKQLDEAERHLARVPPTDPNYIDATNFRADIALKQRRHADAVRLFHSAARADPQHRAPSSNARYQDAYLRTATRNGFDLSSSPQSLVVAGPRMLMHTERGMLAQEIGTGKLLWSVELRNSPSQTSDRPVVAGDVVVTSDRSSRAYDSSDRYRDSSHIVALEIATGKERFRHKISQYGQRFFGASDGAHVYLLASSTDKRYSPQELRALDATTGARLWSYTLDSEGGPVTTSNGRVFVRTKSGTIHAVAATDGHPLWSLALPSPFNAENLVASDTLVYFSTIDGRVIALDATETQYERPLERVRWEALKPMSMNNDAILGLVGELLIVPRRDHIEVLDAKTGKARFEITLPHTEMSSNIQRQSAGGEGDVLWAVCTFGLAVFDPQGRTRYAASNYWGTRSLLQYTALAGDTLLVTAMDNERRTPILLALETSPPISFNPEAK